MGKKPVSHVFSDQGCRLLKFGVIAKLKMDTRDQG